MDSVIVSTPAKINWTLDILSVDERGYHILDMLMQRITLFDSVTITKAEEISLSSNQRWLPCDEKNTAFKSALLFFEATGIQGGSKIYIKKNIPSGAGLAGGSADAAAVLKGLNALYKFPLSEDELATIALKIGADVPFMLKSGLYRAGGIGEKLEKLPTPEPYPLLLVMNRRQSASTKKVYGLYDKIGSNQKPRTDAFIEALKAKDYEKMRFSGGNVLTESAINIAPDIEDNLKRLNDAGSLFTSMTGSGSVCFGVFKNIDDAVQAERLFSDRWHYVCHASSCGIRIKENLR